ncbi:uncharacterized protein LOC120189891 [Hibiscus syriacus]|uniref:uncharacterized protein LOC120189891 n=1 Tax=Hibiscus syriacus TaxID=106335 RepID=UPI001922F7D4|nr:uncharacterized protein LOC120189891 [Hibiscus syriacus]
MKLSQLNVKDMHFLFFSLGLDEHSIVSSCFDAKDIWDKLEVTHEGNNQVKKSKIGILILNYENIKKKPDEDIKTMYVWFTSIINELKIFGKSYPNEEVVRKILYSLPMSWEGKVTAIEKAKNFELFTLDELIDSLLTHNIILKRNQEEKEQEKE